MNRREFVVATAALAATSTLQTPAAPTPSPAKTQATLPDDLVWRDVRQWGVEGRGFDDTESYFDRLPARAKDVVRKEVWGLAQDSAGMSARFTTDAPAIYVRYENTKSELAMPHMPATGVSGVDLYAQVENKWRWAATLLAKSQVTASSLVKLPAAKRNYQINLPLYNGMKMLEIGVGKGASFEPIPPRKDKPILFYGTSITQGGCASRPGMAFIAILGRRLDRPMLNFGFSGNGRTEMKVAQFLVEIDASLFVLDCMGNMQDEWVRPRTIEVVKFLREKRPSMPILVLGDRIYANADVNTPELQTHRKRIEDLKATCAMLEADGVTNLHFRSADDVIGDDGEATVDGSHPTDLGMMRYADALEPTLRGLLK